MSFKTDNPERQAASPYYQAGCADGWRDTDLITQCPALDPLGMDDERAWSWMYRRGYEESFIDDRHVCNDACGGDR